MGELQVVSVERRNKRAFRAVIRWNFVEVIFVLGSDGNPVVSGKINTEGTRGPERTYIPPRRYAEMTRMAYAIFNERPKNKEN